MQLSCSKRLVAMPSRSHVTSAALIFHLASSRRTLQRFNQSSMSVAPWLAHTVTHRSRVLLRMSGMLQTRSRVTADLHTFRSAPTDCDRPLEQFLATPFCLDAVWPRGCDLHGESRPVYRLAGHEHLTCNVAFQHLAPASLQRSAVDQEAQDYSGRREEVHRDAPGVHRPRPPYRDSLPKPSNSPAANRIEPGQALID